MRIWSCANMVRAQHAGKQSKAGQGITTHNRAGKVRVKYKRRQRTRLEMTR